MSIVDNCIVVLFLFDQFVYPLSRTTSTNSERVLARTNAEGFRKIANPAPALVELD